MVAGASRCPASLFCVAFLSGRVSRTMRICDEEPNYGTLRRVPGTLATRN